MVFFGWSRTLLAAAGLAGVHSLQPLASGGRNLFFAFKDGHHAVVSTTSDAPTVVWRDLRTEHVESVVFRARRGVELEVKLSSGPISFSQFQLHRSGKLQYGTRSGPQAVFKMPSSDAVKKTQRIFAGLKKLDFPNKGVHTRGPRGRLFEALQEKPSIEVQLKATVDNANLLALCEAADDLIIKRVADEETDDESDDSSDDEHCGEECQIEDELAEANELVDRIRGDQTTTRTMSPTRVNIAQRLTRPVHAEDRGDDEKERSGRLRKVKDNSEEEDDDETTDEDDRCMVDERDRESKSYVDFSGGRSGVFAGFSKPIPSTSACSGGLNALNDPDSQLWIYLSNNIYAVPESMKRKVAELVSGRSGWKQSNSWDFGEDIQLAACDIVGKRRRLFKEVEKEVDENALDVTLRNRNAREQRTMRRPSLAISS